MHTPGPWIATTDGPHQDSDGKYQQWYVRNDELNHPVCQVFYVTKQGEADAKLIAAAPRMAAMLWECRRTIDLCLTGTERDNAEPLIQAIDELLTEAVGKQ